MMDMDKTYPFPKHDTDIRIKQKPEWHRKMAEAILYTAAKYPQMTNYQRRHDYVENRLYAEGNQSVEKYKKWLTSVNETGERVGYFNYDWTPISVISKYRDVVLGYISALEYDIVVQAVDQYAEDEKKRQKFLIWADKMMQGKMKEIEKLAGTPLMQQQLDYLPESLEELEIYMENQGLKLPDEMAFEEAINICVHVNDLMKIIPKIDEDLFDLGLGATKTYTDSEGRVRIRYVDMVNFLYVGQSDRLELGNVLGMGELRLISIHELKELAGDEFTDKQYEEIAIAAQGKLGNPAATAVFNNQPINTDHTYGAEWENWKVMIFDCQYDSNDSVAQLKRIDKDGNYRYYNKPRNYKPKGDNEKLKVTYLNTKYESCYVIGTPYVFSYGKVKDIVDSPTDLRRTQYDYTIHKISNSSHIDRMKPIADSIQLTSLKMQAMKAKAKAAGVKINLKAISNINYGGVILDARQVVKIYHDTGDLIYDDTEHYGMDNPYIGGSRPSPVEELAGGIGNAFIELLNARNADIQLIESITGLNEIFAAGTPQKSQLVGTAQIAQQQSVSSLGKIINGRRLIIEGTIQKVGAKLQWIAKYGGIENYTHAIGSSTVALLKTNIDFSLRNMGIKIEAKANDEQKRVLFEAAMRALDVRTQSGKGGITLADFLMVDRKIREGRLRAAEALLNWRMQKQMEKDMEHDEALSKANAQNHAQSAQVAEEEKRKSEQQQTMNDIVKEKVKSSLRMMEDNNKAKNEAITLAMQNSQDVKAVEQKFNERINSLQQEITGLMKELASQGQEQSVAA
jgi:hypothetical protein